MGSAVYPAGLVAEKGETLALSTTIASLGIPAGYQGAILYSPATDFRAHFNPKIKQIVFYNSAASAGSRFEYSDLLTALTDRTSAGTGTTLDSMLVTNDYLYICFTDICAGMRVDMTASVNGTANTMVIEYYKNDDTWAALSVTDGTDTGASLAQDGNVTWTAVTDWKAIGLKDALETAATPKATEDAKNDSGYWIRVSFTTGGLDADTEIEDIWALHNDTSRGYYRAGVEYAVALDRRSIGAVEALVASGTDTLQLTWTRS
tara:strand:- start:105 stop:890 length:786 start_codon:yes stop_codon:yes gene_type:complete